MTQNNYNGTLQKPINSGFTAANTASEVIKGIDLTGKNVIVTGGYAGIGLETAKTFASAGASVIVPARDLEKAQKNLAGIANIQIEEMDLNNPESINAFAEKFLASGKPLHILANNAGIMFVPLLRDSRGNELQFSTNHLGHFQLTALLFPALKKVNGARVVNVSSWGHHFSKIDFDDPNFQHREYDALISYGQSKTANVLFSLELDNRGKSFGVRSYSLHPGGIVDTDLKRHLNPEDLIAQGVVDEKGNTIYDTSIGLKTIPQGASTTVWAATSPLLNETGGVYCENNEVALLESNITEPVGYVDSRSLGGIAIFALEKEAAKKLWTLSEELTGVKFDV